MVISVTNASVISFSSFKCDVVGAKFGVFFPVLLLELSTETKVK